MEHTTHPLENVDLAEGALERVAPLGPVLYRSMEPSIQDALAYFSGRPYDAYVFADLVRYHTKCRLNNMALPPGVQFEELPNNGLRFLCNETLVRVWKADEGGELQGPGRSRAKQQYFRQPSLLLTLPTSVRYAVVWDYDSMSSSLSFSLACPRDFDAFRPWKNASCHFYIAFPHAATEIVVNERFLRNPTEGDIELTLKRIVDTGGIDNDDEQ